MRSVALFYAREFSIGTFDVMSTLTIRKAGAIPSPSSI